MIQYRAHDSDEWVEVDETGCLPDGTKVVHFDGFVMRFDAGEFNRPSGIYVDDADTDIVIEGNTFGDVDK